MGNGASPSFLKRGPRVLLRDFAPDDLPQYGQWLRRPEWRALDGPYMGPPDVAASVAAAARAPADPRQRVVIEFEQRLIGTLARYWISRETNWTALGIDLYDPACWGRGLGFEALELWCDYLFACRHAFARLDLRTWSGNPRMMRLAEKLGFRQEACFRKARVLDGTYYDSVGYGILREEWDAR